MALNRIERRRRIHYRIRKHVSGTAQRPRLAVFRSNKANNLTMFELADEKACHLSDAGIHIAEGEAAAAIKAASEETPEISTVTIESDFPQQAPALLCLIKSSETQLKKIL